MPFLDLFVAMINDYIYLFCLIILILSQSIKLFLRIVFFLWQKLKSQASSLDNRSQLVLIYGMGPQVFLNCAGFIKIDATNVGDNTEVLDSTRIHPETYDWARKMAVDALEYDEVVLPSIHLQNDRLPFNREL